MGISTNKFWKVNVVTAAAAFSPSDLDNGLFWLDASQESFNDNDAVGTFSDQFGSNDFTQTTASYKPVFKTNIVNGKPVVRFDGIDNGLKAAGPLIPSGANFTFFIVLKNTTTQADFSCPFDQALGAENKNFGIQYMSYNAPHPTLLGQGTYRMKNYLNTDLNWHIITRHQTGTTATAYLDGDLETVNLLTGSGPNYGPDLTSWTCTLNATDSDRNDAKLGYLGLDNDGYRDRFWDGDIAEVIAYNDALSAGELTSVHDYLKTKYSIS